MNKRYLLITLIGLLSFGIINGMDGLDFVEETKKRDCHIVEYDQSRDDNYLYPIVTAHSQMLGCDWSRFKKIIQDEKTLVARHNDKDLEVLGFVSYSVKPEFGPQGPCYVGHIHLLAVASPFQRNGIGTLLIQNAIQKLRLDKEIEAIIIRVAAKNLNAQLFYLALGFQGYKEDGDSFLLQMDVNS